MKPKTCSYQHKDFKCNYPSWSKGRCKWHPLEKPKQLKRSPINPVSKKQAKRLRAYRKERDAFLEENPTCMHPGCSQPSTNHHAKGRIGDDLTDRSSFRNLCSNHHRYAEEHPLWAKRLGYSVGRLVV